MLDGTERQLAALEIDDDDDGYREMLRLARRCKQRRWAVEGAVGVGAQLAQRLVSDGETVLDVPAELSARVRMLDRGHSRKTDPGDARTVAIVALRTSDLTVVQPATSSSRYGCCPSDAERWSRCERRRSTGSTSCWSSSSPAARSVT